MGPQTTSLGPQLILLLQLGSRDPGTAALGQTDTHTQCWRPTSSNTSLPMPTMGNPQAPVGLCPGCSIWKDIQCLGIKTTFFSRKTNFFRLIKKHETSAAAQCCCGAA